MRHAILRRQRPAGLGSSRRPAALGVALPDLAAGLDAMVLVKPATVVQWHRKGFRLYWRWRSVAPVGRPKMSARSVI